MITEKTMTTWLAEFGKLCDGKPPESLVGLEYLVKIQGEMIKDEPMATALISQIMGTLKIDNPISSALLALAIYHDCRRRQNESNKLSKDLS